MCIREIGFFQRRQALATIAWVDVSDADPADTRPGLGLSQCDAMRRFHVLAPNGQLTSGAAAFATLWQHYPGFKPFGHILALPVIRRVAEVAYRGFLVVRPWMQRRARALLDDTATE